MLLRVYSNCFLRNHTGKVVLHVLPSRWKLYIYIYVKLKNPYKLSFGYYKFISTGKEKPDSS